MTARESQASQSAERVADLRARVVASVSKAGVLAGCRAVLSSLGISYVIGTGGSFSAAYFAAQAINRYGSLFAIPVYPYEYIRTARPTDSVLLISHSGSTSDISAAALHAKTLGVNRVILLTGGAANPDAARTLDPHRDVLISYGSEHDPAERGFVSIFGTVAPCALWAATVTGDENFAELLDYWPWIESEASSVGDQLAESLSKDDPLPVLSGGYAMPAMIDLESKFTETNLGVVMRHEVKDFSHGRFMSVLCSNRDGTPSLIIAVHRLSAYERRLSRVLESRGQAFRYTSHFDGILGAFELMVAVQFITERIGASKGIDISKPGDIREQGLDLYKYRLQGYDAEP